MEGPVIRPMEERDVPFILDSWVRCWRDSKFSGVLPWRPYFHAHRDLFLSVIKKRAKVLVEIAPDTDPASEILGYLVYEEWRYPIIHWAFTKGPWPKEKPIMTFRQKGVLTRLLEAAGIDPAKSPTYLSCWTGDAVRIVKHKQRKGVIWQLRHDPWFLSDPKWKERLDAPSRPSHLRRQDPAPASREDHRRGDGEDRLPGE